MNLYVLLIAVLSLSHTGYSQAIPRPRLVVSGEDVIVEGEKRKLTCMIDKVQAESEGVLTMVIRNGTTELKTTSKLVQKGSQVSEELDTDDQVMGRQEDGGGELHCEVTWMGTTYTVYLRDPDQQNITVFYLPYTSSLKVRRLGVSDRPHAAALRCRVSASNPPTTLRWSFNSSSGPSDIRGRTIGEGGEVEEGYGEGEELSSQSVLILTDEDDGKGVVCGVAYERTRLSTGFESIDVTYLDQKVTVSIADLPFPAQRLAATVTGESTVNVTWRAPNRNPVTWHVTLQRGGNVTANVTLDSSAESLLSQEFSGLDLGEYMVAVYGSNPIGDSEHATTSVIIPEPEKQIPEVIIVGVVLAVIIVVLIIVIILLLFRKKTRNDGGGDGGVNRKELPLPPTPSRYTQEPTTSSKKTGDASKTRPISTISTYETEDYEEPVDYRSPASAYYNDGPEAEYQDAETNVPIGSKFKQTPSRALPSAESRSPSGAPTSGYANAAFHASRAGNSYAAPGITAQEDQEYEELDRMDPTAAADVDALVRSVSSQDRGEVPCRDSGDVSRGARLHQGLFCSVHDVTGVDGKATQVAKILKAGCKQDESVMFLNSIVALRKAGTHENVVRAVSCNVQSVPRYVILEKSEHGDLLSYMQGKQFIGAGDNKNFVSAILQGLLYLHQRQPNLLMLCLNCHHILLTNNLTCKLTNFGTESHVAAWHAYCTRRQHHATLRWLAPETITSSVHTTMSDAWSFGLVLYQIYAKGKAIPYEDVKDRDMKVKAMKQALALDYNVIPKEAAAVVKKFILTKPDKRMKLEKLQAQLNLFL